MSCFTFVTNQRKNIPPEMTIQEMRVLLNFSVHSLLQYIVSATYTKFLYMNTTIALRSLNDSQYAFNTFTKFLYMDMAIALRSLNEMQQIASMRFTII